MTGPVNGGVGKAPTGTLKPGGVDQTGTLIRNFGLRNCALGPIHVFWILGGNNRFTGFLIAYKSGYNVCPTTGFYFKRDQPIVSEMFAHGQYSLSGSGGKISVVVDGWLYTATFTRSYSWDANKDVIVITTWMVERA